MESILMSCEKISIKVVDKNGKPIPFAGFGLRGIDYFQTGGSTDLNGYAEKTFRLRGDNEEFILFVNDWINIVTYCIKF